MCRREDKPMTGKPQIRRKRGKAKRYKKWKLRVYNESN